MAVEVPQNEEISERGVGYAIRRRGVNRGSIKIKEREQGGVV